MKVIVVRHGETRENARMVLMGHRHGTLSRNGAAQARRLALKLKGQKIDAIFSSDLRRARDTTAQIARYHDVPVFYSKALREQNYGIFQGRPLKEMLMAQKSKGTASFSFRPRNGESAADVRRRVRRFMNGLMLRYKHKTILISAHSGIVWSILSVYGHVPFDKLTRMKPKNAGVLILQIDGSKSRLMKSDMFGAAHSIIP